MVTTVTSVMTIHVLHAGDGYLYLIRSVAVHDGRLAPGSSLAALLHGERQPPGRWAGMAAAALGVAGVVTEEQMRALFGEGLHPERRRRSRRRLRASGVSEAAAIRATRLGRRFPQYGRRAAITAAGPATPTAEREAELGRPLTEEEKLAARQEAAGAGVRAAGRSGAVGSGRAGVPRARGRRGGRRSPATT